MKIENFMNMENKNMQKIMAVFVIFSFLFFNISFVEPVSAQETITETIPSISRAKQIAIIADGIFQEGEAIPSLEENQVALPVLDPKTGKIVGRIIADKTKLIAALRTAGYTRVADALAEVKPGTAIDAPSKEPPPALKEIVEKISSVDEAKKIAKMAEGDYWEGASLPVLDANEVALPIIDQKRNVIIGHIVAERQPLIAVLNNTGYSKVASALAAMEAGTFAGLAVKSGVAFGKTGLYALGGAVLIGLVLAVAGGGGGGGNGGITPTPQHP
jgi:hypothetical protein